MLTLLPAGLALDAAGKRAKLWAIPAPSTPGSCSDAGANEAEAVFGNAWFMTL